MNLKVTQGHPNCRCLTENTSHPIVACSNDDFILHHFRDTDCIS